MRVKTILFITLLSLLSACAGTGSQNVSQEEIATKVALLKLTAEPGQTGGENGVIIATVQTAAVLPTVTLTITPTTPASDPASYLGAPTWRDTFDGSNNFYTTSDENVLFNYGTGTFNMTAYNVNGWHSWSLGGRRIGNFYLEATFKIGNCSSIDRYGLVFRAPDTSQGYFYGASCNGQFGLTRWDTKGQLVDWKTAAPLKAGPDQTNRLGVMARGNTLTLYINGEEVANLTDNRYNEGSFGFYIASHGTYALNVQVEEVAYWNQ